MGPPREAWPRTATFQWAKPHSTQWELAKRRSKWKLAKGGSGLAEGQKANEMQNSIQANARSFCMGGFWEIRGTSQSKGFLLMSPSLLLMCPWVLELTCCAELHNKVYRLNM